MNIVLLGAPGAGKGTQASFIKEKYNLVHISTGDIFRANIKAGTPLGKLAKSYIDDGKLVPDEVTCDLVKDRLSQDDVVQNGYMLDGFPRNVFQATVLDTFSNVDCCIDIEVDTNLLLNRICGRRMCSCGETYHISTYSSDVCAKCGKILYQREDDNPETVGKRLQTYFSQTAPVASYYEQKEKLAKIESGNDSPKEIFVKIENELDKL